MGHYYPDPDIYRETGEIVWADPYKNESLHGAQDETDRADRRFAAWKRKQDELALSLAIRLEAYFQGQIVAS